MPFQNPILGGETLVRNSIRSPDYVPGTSGWSIFRDGSAEFNNTLFRGEGIFGDPDGVHIQITNTGEIYVFDGSNVLSAGWNVDGLGLYDNVTDSALELVLAGGYVTLRLTPPAVPGLTIGPAEVFGDSDGAANDAWAAYTSPQINGGAVARVLAYGQNTATGHPSEINLQASRVSVNGRAIGAGTVARGWSNANSAGITAEAVVLTTNAATYRAGAAFKVTFGQNASSSVAGGRMSFTLRKTNLAGTVLAAAVAEGSATAGASAPASGVLYLRNSTGADITGLALALTLAASGVGNTVTHLGSALTPRWVLVEQCGIDADFDFAKPL